MSRFKNFLFILIIIFFFCRTSTSQWIQLQPIGNGDVRAIVSSGSNIFAGVSASGVYKSTNDGTNWTQTSLTNQGINSLAISGNSIFAGTMTQVFVSTNDGANWTQTSLNHAAYTLEVSGGNIFAGTEAGIFKSTNNGTTWTPMALNAYQVFAIKEMYGALFAGAYGIGIYKSTNNGSSWVQSSLGTNDIRSFAYSNGNIFAGAQDSPLGVYVSTDSGTTWNHTSLVSNTGAMTQSGNLVFAGTANYPVGTGGIWISADGGSGWTLRNEGYIINANSNVMSLLATGNYIFAGSWGNSIWRRSLSEILTGIPKSGTEMPGKYELGQNYPNPFNPSTVIRYSLPKSSFVSLKVYDILGREVKALFSGYKSAGSYSDEFDASDLSSGVYFYSIVTEEFKAAKSMVLIK